MKKKLLLLGLLFNFFHCIAQNGQYIPFPKEMIVYSLITRGSSDAGWYGSSRLEIYGDTLLNGKNYSKCFLAESNRRGSNNSWPTTDLKGLNKLIGGIRDEVASKKVYFYSFNTKQEELLYDFDLHIGDTLFKDDGYRFYRSLLSEEDLPPKIDTVWVSRIDSVLMPHDGRYHKRFNFKTKFQYMRVDTVISTDSVCNKISYFEIKINPLIEGVGIDLNPIVHFNTFEYGFDFALFCRTIDGKKAFEGTPPMIPFMSTANCQSIVSAVEEEDKQFGFTVYPNPSSGEFELKMTGTTFNRIEIYNLLGVNIWNSAISTSELKIDCPVKVPGIYFIRLYKSNGQSITQKIAIE